uniref:Nose resistant-to-fluoxetine protein N-terminal domain-containing protein n=1 Tax=Timema monikensis TaxID=170555 RepID=A0A7R9E7J8_9NEOP|nr:unnamed protein product [Timema monikensis]
MFKELLVTRPGGNRDKYVGHIWFAGNHTFEGNESCRKANVHSSFREPNTISDKTAVPSALLLELVERFAVFAPTSDRIINERCRSQSRLYVRHVRQFQLWALKMHDSSAKVPSGLLNGNVNQYGDYDQCLEVGTEPDHPVQGKYCLAYLDLDLKTTAAAVVPETVKEVNTLLHSYHAMRSQFHDPGHRIPRFSAINWAFCLPSTCTAEDLQQALQEAFEPYNNHTELALKVKVDPAMCYTRQGQPVTFTALCAILFFVAIIAATVIGTFRDYCNISQSEDSTFWKLVKCFSLRRNWKTLSNTKSSPDDVKSVHGLRAINALALIMFHKSAAFQFNPYTNRTAMQWSLSLAWSIIGRTSIIYTDSFIMFSGLLTSYSFLKDLERNKCLNVWEKYISRYIRFTPNLLAIILFCTYVMTHLGSGPQWNLVVQHHADICQETMWRNFLYIHNYFGFQNMCLTHTHQLGIDMQLFLISPLVVYLLWKSRWLGVLLILTVCWWSTVLRYTVTYNNNLSTVVYFGVPVAKLFDTANLSYILPTHRATIYLIGVLVGYWLRNMRKIHLNKMAVGVGWTVAIALALLAMCGPYHMARLHYSYNPEDAALYNAWSPIVWSGFLIWAIFATEQGYGGVIGDLLRWKGFVVFTRVAYAVYLTQFPIFFYNVGTTRHSHYYRPYMLFEMGEVTCILIAAVGMTLLFDLPAQEIKKTFWRSSSSYSYLDVLQLVAKERYILLAHTNVRKNFAVSYLAGDGDAIEKIYGKETKLSRANR